MKIFIMRGLPGCGKSFWIAANSAQRYGVTSANVVCSADYGHIIDGVYRYDPLKAGEAHGICLVKYVDCIHSLLKTPGLPTDYQIFVDNTNTSIFELAPYVQLAIAYKIPYEIVYILCSVETSLKRNTHNVPASTILDMNRRLLTESLPPWWKIKVV